MMTETKRIVALAGLIIAVGVGMVELTRSEAQADPALVVGGAAGYAGQRVDAAFELAATVPPATFEYAIAEKGDMLPIGCAGPFRPEVAAECMDTAYEVESEVPALIVETREGAATSILTRMSELTVAEF